MSVDLDVAHRMTAGGASPRRRAEILRHVTDLFIVRADDLSEDEILLFDDVLIRLTVEIEIAAKALLAMRLAPLAKAPPRVIRELASDDAIEVAGPVLSQSERLDEETLLKNARVKGQAHLLAIAQRRKLTEAVTEVLVERGDQQVLLRTAQNAGARFYHHAFNRLAERAEDDESLAMTIGMRDDVPPSIFRKLLKHASESVRVKLQASHPGYVSLVREVVSEVTKRIEDEHFGASESAGRAERAETRLSEIVGEGSLPELSIALSQVCDMPVVFVENALKQRRPDTVLLLTKAKNMPWALVKSILMLRVRLGLMLPKEVEQCRQSYERIVPEAADKIVNFYRNR